ncbi:hypothetical protein [Streptomyces sp. RKAG293]|uniref:hypothetical protein n=1 Tax=Streptomyces sp. RKAG293 TaxID=2893403 RepID=UPI0020343579|nr:hypothetical protein [Streptomyces sp. RKAG293]MCM2420225.1 hypothetical protein [Streptomyces sp. RKAG293]
MWQSETVGGGVDAEALAIAGTFSGALVSAMATDTWQETRTRVVAIWRRFRTEAADETGRRLEADRTNLLALPRDQRRQAESDLILRWRVELLQLVQCDSTAGQALEDALLGREQAVELRIHQTGRASGDGRIFMAGRDQNFNGNE